MRTITILTLLFSCSIVLAQKVEKVWETDQVLKVPESVLYNETTLYVSNVNGAPTEKNEKGFISKLSVDGKVENLEWSKGLNAPKGMGIYNEKLYVSDIDVVAVIDLKDGEIVERISIPESVFLNDISISENGIVAVSDMKTQTIHFIENQKLVKSLKNEQFNYVNGLFWDGAVLLAGTSGIIFKVKFDEDTPVKYIEETGGVDGLEKIADNSFVITDWSGKMQLVAPNKPNVELLNTTEKGINAADIGYNAEDKIIYVPTFKHNTVVAYKFIE